MLYGNSNLSLLVITLLPNNLKQPELTAYGNIVVPVFRAGEWKFQSQLVEDFASFVKWSLIFIKIFIDTDPLKTFSETFHMDIQFSNEIFFLLRYFGLSI